MKHQGFTLIEIAVALLVTGMIATLAISLSSNSQSSECYVATRSQLMTIKEAIERYSYKNDRVPYPARRDVGVEDVAYGREVPLDAGNVVSANLDSATNPDGSVAIFGALPFQTLGIPTEKAVDCWGNKLTYVMTKDLGDSTKFVDNTTKGALSINTNAASVFMSEGGYAVISHGADELGAVKANYAGPGHKWCTAGAAADLSRQNCNAADTVLISGEYNDGKQAGNSYFDDLIVYRGKPWRLKPAVDSNLYCWGRNQTGDVGNGTVAATSTPEVVKANIGFTRVSTGWGTSCGVDGEGLAYCWGDNGYGQIGSTAISYPSSFNKLPVAVTLSGMNAGSGQRFATITEGWSFTCGITINGWAYCWGKGDYGQLGNGDWSTMGNGPQLVPGAYYSAISAGANHACGITMDGDTYCWGGNEAGQIGINRHDGNPMGGGPNNPSSPNLVQAGGVKYTAIAAGRVFTCSLDIAGTAYCWGQGYADVPVAIGVASLPAADRAFSTISAGAGYLNGPAVCALTKLGTAYCWGGTVLGATPTAVDVSALPIGDQKFIDIAVGNAAGGANGADYICGISSTGTTYCWGATFASAMTAPSAKVTDTGISPLVFSRIVGGGESFGGLNCAIAAPF